MEPIDNNGNVNSTCPVLNAVNETSSVQMLVINRRTSKQNSLMLVTDGCINLGDEMNHLKSSPRLAVMGQNHPL